MAPPSRRFRRPTAPSTPCDSPATTPTATTTTTHAAPSLSLSVEQLDACQARAETLLVDTLRAYTQLDGQLDRARWRCLGGRAGVSAFRERSAASSSSSSRSSSTLSLMCVGTLRTRLDDVLAGLYCDSSDDMRAQSAVTCPRVARCAVLQAANTRREGDPDTPFTGVKWAALRALGGCVPDRDVVYFEKSGMVRQEAPGRRRLAYVAMQSVSPAFVGGLGRAGAHMALCYLLEELDAEQPHVGVYMLGSVAGFGPAYLMASVFGDLALSVTRAADVTRAKKLAALMQTVNALGDVDAAPESDGSAMSRPSFQRHRIKSSSACCDECGGVPFVFESLSACAGCRRPRICRRCRSRERVLVRDPRQQRTRVRSAAFCFACRAHVDSRPLRCPPPRSPRSSRSARLLSDDSDAFHDDGAFLDRSRALDASGSSGSDELLGSARSLAVFSLKIAQHLHELDQQSSEQRVSALSSLGTEELARLLLSSGRSDALRSQGEEDDGDEEGDVLESFHAPPKRANAGCGTSVIATFKSGGSGGNSPSERPRLSRYSTASSTSSSCTGDEALEAHRHSLFSRLKAATDQAEQTFHLARAHSQTARAVWMHNRFQWLDLE